MSASILKSNALRVLMALAGLFLSLPVFAQSYKSPQLRNREIGRAYQRLRQAEIFNLGGIGWAQKVTAEEKAFRTLLESVDAPRLFQRLINEANAEGQLYALLGLRLRAPEAFPGEVERVQALGGPPERQEKFIAIEKGKVRVGRGCILSREDFPTVLKQISTGDWDPKLSSDFRKPAY